MKILIAKPFYDSYLPDIKAIAPDVDFSMIDGSGALPPEIAQAEAIAWWWYGSNLDRLVQAAPKLRWIHVPSAGVDRLITPAVRSAAGLTLTDSGPAYDIAIPEYVLAWIMAIAKRVPQFLDHQKNREWTDETQGDLHGSTVGIIGLGPIGRGVAWRAKALGMSTLGYRRRQNTVEGVDEVLTGPAGLDRLLAESDYIVLAAALTEATREILGKEQIARIQPTAWVINIARGALIDQGALTKALQEKRIGGACLDVFTTEPLPKDDPLWDLPNVLITPHDAHGGGEALQQRRKELFLDNLKRFVHGEPLQNVVDFEHGY